MLKLQRLGKKNFLSISDMNEIEIKNLIDISKKFKNDEYKIEFKNRVLGLIFDKASTRTRVSFQVATVSYTHLTLPTTVRV